MDSYNLFGDDGSGMLEGLTDLGGSDSFAGSSASGVTDNKDSSENRFFTLLLFLILLYLYDFFIFCL